MKKTIILLLAIFATSQISAQFVKEQAIDVAVGYGISAPYDDVDVEGTGFYLQGEYVFTLAKWLDLRPYAGLILTKTKEENLPNVPDYKSNANAFLIGGKVRVTAPIPWVAPYLESGFGASIGSFETFTAFTNLEESGFVFHIPVSVGLKIGPRQNFDFAFTYYYHPSAEQVAGGIAVGVSFPLKNN